MHRAVAGGTPCLLLIVLMPTAAKRAKREATQAVELLGGHPQPPGRVPHGHTWDFVSGVWRNADGVERNADGVEP